MTKDLHLRYMFTDSIGDLVYEVYHHADAKTRNDCFGRVRLAPDLMLDGKDQVLSVSKGEKEKPH